MAENKREQIRRYVTNGKAALDAKDFAAAANAFRIASSLAPDDAALAAPDLLPAPQQQAQLLLAPDQRGQRSGGVERLEPARSYAGAEDAIGPHRVGETLDVDHAQVRTLEQVADEAAGALGDDDAAGLGQGLQPGGQVRRLADHRLLASRTAAQEVADHRDAGRDADPDPERSTGHGRAQLAHRRHDIEAGADRPLGLVLVGLRPAEVGQHAVAHVLGDETAFLFDRPCDTGVEGADQLAQILWVEAGREGGRADQVREQHRELPPLGLARGHERRGRGAGRCGTGPQGGDPSEQPLAVADRGNADLLEVLGGQARQDPRIDVVVAERRLILAQAQAAQPSPDIHPVSHEERSLPRPQSIPSRARPTRATGRLPPRRRVPWPYSDRRRSPARTFGSPSTAAG